MLKQLNLDSGKPVRMADSPVYTMLYSNNFQDSILVASFWCTPLFMQFRPRTCERKPAGSLRL